MRLPPSCINLPFQLPTNHCLHPMRQPHIPEQSVIPSLVEDQPALVPEPGVDFAVLVKVWRIKEGTLTIVEQQHTAFANVYEDANIFTAAGRH